MLPLDIPLLQTFLDLTETGSFTRTAKRVHRTQSAVSAQLRRLEDLLGVTLFERTTRAVTINADGERLLPHAQAVLTAAAALSARFETGAVTGDVRLGCPEDVASADLPMVLADFAASHPGVRMHVRCDLTLHLVEQFEAGAFDMILIKQDPQRIMPGAQLLRQEQLCWMGTPSMAEAGPDAMTRLVLAPAPCVYRARAIEALSGAQLGSDVVYASTSEAGQIAAVRAGLGMTVLPRHRVPNDLAIAVDGWPPLRDAAICLLTTPRRTAALEAFSGHIETRLRPISAMA